MCVLCGVAWLCNGSKADRAGVGTCAHSCLQGHVWVVECVLCMFCAVACFIVLWVLHFCLLFVEVCMAYTVCVFPFVYHG